MSPLNERSIAKFLYNPFVIFVNDVGGDIPAIPSFYTEPGIKFNFNREFVKSKTYERNGGVLYTARAEMSSFEFMAGFSIKETTVKGINFVEGGTINSDSDEIRLDGTHQKWAVWFESCFNDTGKIIRVIIPVCKSVDAVALDTGTAHVLHPNNLLALVDSNNPETFPSIYIQP